MVAFLSSAVAEGMVVNSGFGKFIRYCSLLKIFPIPVTALLDYHMQKNQGSAIGFMAYFHEIMAPLEYQKSQRPSTANKIK